MFSITFGSSLISSALAHLESDFFCFGERDNFPCLSEKEYGKIKRSCRSPAMKGTYSRPLIKDVMAKTFFSSTEYDWDPDTFKDEIED